MMAFRHIPWQTELENTGVEVSQIAIEAGFARSKTDFRKLILNGGLKIDTVSIKDPKARLMHDEHDTFFLMEHQ